MKKNDLIEKIHEEFDSASEKMLTKAKAILDSPDKKEEKDSKAEFLHSVGFVSARGVPDYMERCIDTKSYNTDLKYNKEKAKNFAGFISGAVYKVVSYWQVMGICEKYGLYLGRSERFIGDIPSKNVEDIKWFEKYREKNIPAVDIDKEVPLSSQIIHPLDQTVKSADYYMVAPKNDFDLRGAGIVGKEIYNREHKSFIKLFRTRLQDPVVLCPVVNSHSLFFYIVTKWGAEADIKEFQNPKDN